MAIREEADNQQRYDVRYELSAYSVSRTIEREAVGSDYGNSGFTTTEQADRLADLLTLTADTADFLASSRAWRTARICHRAELRPLNPDVYDDRIAHCTAEIEAVESGLLRRVLYVAARPEPGNGG